MERYFMVPWLAPPLALLVLVILVICLVASYWWRTRPSNEPVRSKIGLRRYIALGVLAIPAVIVAGSFLLLFPVGMPETVVLRSRAALLSSQSSDGTCFEQAFVALAQPHLKIQRLGCDETELQPSSRIVDAGPLVERALAAFYAETNFSLEQLQLKGPEVLDALKRAVSFGLSMQPPKIDSLPTQPDGTTSDRRWLIQAVEVAVLEGLTLRRNVRNIVVERHLTDFDEADSDPWRALLARVQNQTVAHRPAVRIENGSTRGVHAFASIAGQPWIRRRGDNGELFVLVRKGPEASDARLAFVAGDQAMQIACGSHPSSLFVSLSECVPEFETLSPGTLQLLSVRVHAAVGDGPLWLRLTVDQSGESSSAQVMDRNDVQSVRISGMGLVRTTLRCLLNKMSPTASAFVAHLQDGGRQAVELAPTGTAHVTIATDPDGLWIIPSDARPGLRDEIAKAQLWPDDVFANATTAGGRQFGLMLFPYVGRADGSAPGAGAMMEAPLATRRAVPYTDPREDPASNVQSPRTIRINRGDARPVAYSYARDNYTVWVDRIFPTAFSPVAWRIDVSRGRVDGSAATVWRYALDLEREGLLLQETCDPTRNLPDLTQTPFGSAIATYEPKYESSRFFPFWGAILSAARTSASPDSELAASAHSKPVMPPMLLDETLRSQIRIRSAQLGLELLLTGLILHVALMVWFRFRSARA